jgi:FtsH-binding integral membrane protein
MAADIFNRLTGRTSALPDGMPFSKLFDVGHIDARIQAHLRDVYGALAGCVLAAAAGAAVDVRFGIGGVLTTIAAFAALFAVLSLPPTPANARKRAGALAAFSFLEGVSMGPLIGLAVAVHPAALVLAALGTAAVFACFSAAALLTPRRSYLFLGGWLSSAVLGMLAVRMGAWLFGLGRLAFEMELVVGLAVFAGYVIFDTQVIVERCGAGDFDVVKHALDLFVDAAAVFVRCVDSCCRGEGGGKQAAADRRQS